MLTLKRSSERSLFLISFLIIPMIVLALFVIYPMIRLFQISVTDWDGLSDNYSITGLKNFIDILFHSPNVWLSLKNNLIYFVIHLVAIPVEIFIAFLLDTKIRGSKFFKSVIFMPFIINGVAISYMFSLLYSSEGGALNQALSYLNIAPVNWISNPHIVNFSLAFVSIWRFSGMHIIIFLAALQSINDDIMEASILDGANLLKQFLYIVIPNILTTIEIILFLNVRGALQVFDIPFIMTNGGPGHASSTFTLHTIETAFQFNSFGKASAMAIYLIILIIMISKIQSSALKKKG